MSSTEASGVSSLVSRHARAVGYWTAASRVAALLRDSVLSHFFGASAVTDAFLAAFFVPDTFRTLVAESAVSPAIVPALVSAQARGGALAVRQLLASLLGWLPVLTFGIAGLAFVAAPRLMQALAPGFAHSPQTQAMAVLLLRTMLPYLVLANLVAVLVAALQHESRFSAAAATSLVFNVAHVLAVMTLGLWIKPVPIGLALGVLLGGVAQLALVGWAVSRRARMPRPALRWAPESWQVITAMLPVITAMAGYQLSVLVLPAFASHMGEAAISQIYYADRFARLPIGLIGVAIATAALPQFAATGPGKQTGALAALIEQALRLSHRVSVPAALGLAVLAEPMAAAILQHGRFAREMTVPTSQAIMGLAVGLVAIGDVRVVCQGFFSLGERRVPMLLTALAVALTALFATYLAQPWGVGGLALSVSLAAWVQLGWLLWLLRARLKTLALRRVAWSIARDLAAALPMGIVASGLARQADWLSGTTAANVLVLLTSVGVGMGTYFGLQRLFDIAAFAIHRRRADP